MEMLDLSGKVHDEQRQGEAFSSPIPVEKTYQKHFYIESYGCAMNFSDSESGCIYTSSQRFWSNFAF